ncbi:hypothetical protein MHB42_18840 [Lysinibacillus sp. FSL K6-0232]|uniref:hypothetical protein n=1 Tax=unclassified Lysinibacillus TaxID=2636778 RepID=UPI0030FC02F1
MNKLLVVFYFISIIITAIIFALINVLTGPVLLERSSISNGNPGLFPLIFLTPFLIISIIGTFKLAIMLARKMFKTVQFYLMMICLLVFSSVIYWLTFKEAQALRLFIFQHNHSVTEIAEIPLLNTYSNAIFFNGWTLLALLFTASGIAYIWTFIQHRQ